MILFLQHLSLTNFRNYARLELDLSSGVSIFGGGNAQGKTNLLEAVYFISTARPLGGTAEREVVSWWAWGEGMGFCRLSAWVSGERGKSRLEILLLLKRVSPPQVKKVIRVNGVVRRVSELVGRLRAVMFSPRDIDLIGGEPLLRRRWLDLLNVQLSPHHLKMMLHYSRVLAQRNNLLRAIAIQKASPSELPFWDRELVECGSGIIFQRQNAVKQLAEIVRVIHQKLSGGKEELAMNYYQSISPRRGLEDLQEIKHLFKLSLEGNREKEIKLGISLAGPHRDDLRFLVNGIDMGTYGSRGQQRTIALSLKLAEAKFIRLETHEPPVLLLDDVLSELDEERRDHLLRAISDYHQVLITTTDLDRFSPSFLSQVEKFKIEEGRVESLAGAANSAR